MKLLSWINNYLFEIMIIFIIIGITVGFICMVSYDSNSKCLVQVNQGRTYVIQQGTYTTFENQIVCLIQH